MAATTGKALHVTVITPARAVLDAQATSVVVPAFDGELGILANHAPLLAVLGIGTARITKTDGQVQQLAVRGGFVQVNQNNVTILTPESVATSEIKIDALDAENAKLAVEKPVKAEEIEQLNAKKQWVATRKKVAAAK